MDELKILFHKHFCLISFKIIRYKLPDPLSSYENKIVTMPLGSQIDYHFSICMEVYSHYYQNIKKRFIVGFSVSLSVPLVGLLFSVRQRKEEL